MVLDHVHISHVSKLGDMIPCVNLLPSCSCRPDAPCVSRCYARKGRFRFKNVVSLMEKNFRIYREDPAFFEREVMIAASAAKYFRWHSAGDIPDEAYFAMMVRIAERIPDTRFLCFTKQYHIINQFLLSGGVIPANLTVIFSLWNRFGEDQNPFQMPTAHIQFRDRSAFVPHHARECSGFCGDCVASRQSCWDLQRGEAVYFNEH